MIRNIAADDSRNGKLRPLLLLLIVWIGLAAGVEVRSGRADEGAAEGTVSASPLVLERDIVPILRAYCWK